MEAEHRSLEEELQLVRAEVELEICFPAFSLDVAQALAEAVQGNSRLRSLDLAGSNIGPLMSMSGGGLPQVEAVANGLRGSSVTALGLHFTGLDNTGVAALAPVLRETSLRSLDLGHNGIGVEGLEALAEGLRSSKVTSVRLSGNHVLDEGMEILGAVLKETALESLSLGYNGIKVGGARALAEGLRASRVTALDLSDNYFGAEGLTALAAILKETSLHILDVSTNRLNAGGARALAEGLKLSSLAVLKMSGNYSIGDEGARALLEKLQDSPLIDLDLRNCDVSEGVLRAIQVVLEVNKARTFVLQMEVQKSEKELLLKFRTLAGALVASLAWSLDRPVEDLPEAALTSMRRSGCQPPFKGLSPVHLKLVRPDGALVDCAPNAAALAQQLEPPAVAAGSSF